MVRKSKNQMTAAGATGTATRRAPQFGTQVKFRWSRDCNNWTAKNAFSAPWYFSENFEYDDLLV